MIYDVQKASLTRRFAAFLLDLILMSILIVGFLYLLSWITGLDNYSETLSVTYENVTAEYGVDFNTTEDEYNAMTDEQRANYDAAFEALVAELEANNSYAMTYSLLLLCLSLSALLSFVILEFVLPLIFKNGQTLGMKVLGIGLVFTNSVRVTAFALFVRNILGKYTLETMVPTLIVIMILFNTIGIVGYIVLLALLILQIVIFFSTPKTRSFIHDVISNTAVVDMATQMIFPSYDDMVSYKADLAKETSQNAKY